MTAYANLAAGWATSSASPGALPSGVTGTSLYGLGTAAKIAAANAWTVSGSVPTTTTFTGAQLANCINAAEFFSLPDAAQKNILALCAIPGQLLGGSANTAFLPVGTILKYFNVSGPTVLSLTAFAQAVVTPWWQSIGLTSPISPPDLAQAGGLT
jgi:hypothetical protein